MFNYKFWSMSDITNQIQWNAHVTLAKSLRIMYSYLKTAQVTLPGILLISIIIIVIFFRQGI